MKPASVSVHLPQSLHDEVSALATKLDRPAPWVVEQAVRDFIALQNWQLAAIDEGILAADEGNVVPHETVAAWVRSWGQPDELPMPECGSSGRRRRSATSRR